MKLTIAVLLVLLGSPKSAEPTYTRTFSRSDVIATAWSGGPQEAGAIVISSAEQWDSYLKRCDVTLQAQLRKAKVDFAKEVVLAVAVGKFGSVLTDFEKAEAGLRGIIESPELIVVHYQVVQSDARSPEDSFPLFVARLPKTPKKIEFKALARFFGG